MKLTINNQCVEADDGATLDTLIDKYCPEKTGIAVAINNEIVHRGKWKDYKLKDNDSVVIVKAYAGG